MLSKLAVLCIGVSVGVLASHTVKEPRGGFEGVKIEANPKQTATLAKVFADLSKRLGRTDHADVSIKPNGENGIRIYAYFWGPGGTFIFGNEMEVVVRKDGSHTYYPKH